MTVAQAAVRYQVQDAIGCITLDAPPLNLLSAAMMDQLAQALDQAQGDLSLKGVAVTALGTAFSAGADVEEHRPEQAPRMMTAFSGLFRRLGELELPLVMVVDGPALGAGFELAVMADVLLASDRASFGQPEIRLGFFAPVGVTALAARIGVARALEITSTGRTYPAADMLRLGLVSRVVPPEGLAAALGAVLDDLRRASPAVMRLNVRLTRQLQDHPFEAARRQAEEVFLGELMALEDVREGIASFHEKRRPVWKNR